jgi:hypothetical protein
MPLCQSEAMLKGFLILGTVFGVVVGLMWLLHTLNDYVENRVPPYRRELVAMYESFHRFLSAVRCAAPKALE